MRVAIYDTTLRDGTQREGISLSVNDKLRVTELLDNLGVAYIEGGWPGSNPKDAAYFEAVKGLTLKNAKIAAFGSTRRKTDRSGGRSQYSSAGECRYAGRDCVRQNVDFARH